MAWAESARFARQSRALHAFSTRQGGASRAPAAGLNLGFIESDRRATVLKNRKQFFRQIGADPFSLAELRQIHSATIIQVKRGAGGKLEYRPGGYSSPLKSRRVPAPGDALITNEAGILLSVRSADCMTILLADPRRRAVAAIHAGWRGALAGIAEKTVGEMIRIFDSRPRDLLAALGPSIRACCYEVGEEVVAAFCGRNAEGEKFFVRAPHDKTEMEITRRYPLLFLSKHPPGHEPIAHPALHLDLVAAARHQLLRAGLRPSNLHVSDYCTSCRTDLFFSHRAEGRGTGRMMSVIGIRP